MKILIVNAFKDDAEGKRRFKIFKETVIEVRNSSSFRHSTNTKLL